MGRSLVAEEMVSLLPGGAGALMNPIAGKPVKVELSKIEYLIGEFSSMSTTLKI